MHGKSKALLYLPWIVFFLVRCGPASQPANSGSTTDAPPQIDHEDARPNQVRRKSQRFDRPAADLTTRPSKVGNQVVCQGPQTKVGTDVSRYDVDTHWNVAQTSGLSFVFVKATEGVTIVSPLFAGDWQAAKTAGVVRGAYHYFHPSDDPREQAQLFLKTVGTLEHSDLPAMLDWETTDRVRPAKQIQRALIWLEAVEAATHKIPIVYVSPAFWNALGNPVAFARFPLFVAHYGVVCPVVPRPWTSWAFWQKGSGVLQGMRSPKTNIDLFNGSPMDLARLASATNP
jgi:lysozyme